MTRPETAVIASDVATPVKELHDEHAAALWRYAWRLTGDPARAQDVVQETLLRAWQHPEVVLDTERSARSWLFTVARNIIIDESRCLRFRREVSTLDGPGAPERACPDEVNAALDRLLIGEALARLHLAGADFPMRRENALSVAGWRQLYAVCRERANEVQRDLRTVLTAELEQLEREWPRGLPQGVIHADLFPDNVFFLGAKLSGLIDFYFACTDTLVYDVAICLNAWCFEPDHSYNVTKGRALLANYARTRPLSAAEWDKLPLLARGAALRFLLTRLVDWLDVPPGALVRPKDPLEYLRKLRFHQKVKSPADYGVIEP